MEKSFKDNIMRRVYTVHACKKFGRSCLFKIGMLSILALYIISMVSMINIFINMPNISNVSAVIYFYFTAFLHTYLAVQTTIIFMVFLTVLLAKDVIVGFSRIRFMTLIPRRILQRSL